MKIRKFKEKFIPKYAILVNGKYLIQEISDPNDATEKLRFNEQDLLSVVQFCEGISSYYDDLRIVKIFVEYMDEEVEIIKNTKKYNL